MFSEADKLPDKDGVVNRVLLLDELSIQADLEIVKKSHGWNIVGAVDLGPLVNDLEQLSEKT